MKTVDKAFTVLDQFSAERTEIGLSELARLAGLDKAATRRLLLALSKHGFIEQSTETRKYRLGQGFLRLARIREATVPMAQAAQSVVDWLVAEVDETVHVSVPSGASMSTIAFRLPRRGNVINLVPADALLYHATATGYAYMAHATPDTLTRVLGLKRVATAAGTLVEKADVEAKIEETRAQGYARTRNSFEDGVSSVAMPFYFDQEDPAGAISIALPDERMTDARCAELLPFLRDAVARLEKALTGQAH